MGIETVDLYLLHWPGPHALEDTIEAFEDLRDAGKIRHWGVSNFDVDEMEALAAAAGLGPAESCATDQVLYNLSRRGPEFDLMPWCADRSIPIMAYSPLEQGRLMGETALDEIALRHGVSAMQVALAWVLRDPNVIAIPKAADPAHVRQNRAAADLRLDGDDLAVLDAAFPPPDRKQPFELL